MEEGGAGDREGGEEEGHRPREPGEAQQRREPRFHGGDVGGGGDEMMGGERNRGGGDLRGPRAEAAWVQSNTIRGSEARQGGF